MFKVKLCKTNGEVVQEFETEDRNKAKAAAVMCEDIELCCVVTETSEKVVKFRGVKDTAPTPPASE